MKPLIFSLGLRRALFTVSPFEKGALGNVYISATLYNEIGMAS